MCSSAPGCSVPSWLKVWRGCWTRWPSALTAPAPSTPPSTIHHPAPSVPTYRGLPAGAVFGTRRAEASVEGSAATMPTPPPPPPSVATVYYSATSRPLPPLPEGSLRSQASRLSTPARKQLDFESSNLARSTTVIDVSSNIFFF